MNLYKLRFNLWSVSPQTEMMKIKTPQIIEEASFCVNDRNGYRLVAKAASSMSG